MDTLVLGVFNEDLEILGACHARHNDIQLAVLEHGLRHVHCCALQRLAVVAENMEFDTVVCFVAGDVDVEAEANSADGDGAAAVPYTDATK